MNSNYRDDDDWDRISFRRKKKTDLTGFDASENEESAGGRVPRYVLIILGVFVGFLIVNSLGFLGFLLLGSAAFMWFMRKDLFNTWEKKEDEDEGNRLVDYIITKHPDLIKGNDLEKSTLTSREEDKWLDIVESLDDLDITSEGLKNLGKSGKLTRAERRANRKRMKAERKAMRKQKDQDTSG